MMKLYLMLVAVCLLQSSVGAADDGTGGPQVTLPGDGNAVLTGVTTRYDEPDFLGVNKSIDAYLGVRFAQPPVGDLRFADPVPYVIEGETNATVSRATCMQVALDEDDLPIIIPGLRRKIDEDCLYLSIYTPSPTPTSPVPVLVWFHGGNYTIGSGSWVVYDPTPLVALADIVVVNVNYRLGIFGFLTTDDDVAPGNFGMMDQLLALQWIQDNIAAFGGDPMQVTLSGESGGASSVGHHMLSPLSLGLFHKAIMQSGSAATPSAWRTAEAQAVRTRSVAEHFGCPTTNSQAMIDCLRGEDAGELLDIGAGINVPVVDGNFLPEYPTEMIKRRKFQILPSLIGTNANESASDLAFVDVPDSLYERPIVNISTFKSLIRDFPDYPLNAEEVAALEHQYIDWTVADNETADQADGYIRFETDSTFSCPTEYYSRALEEAGAEVYRYELTHQPSWSIYAGVPTWMGAAHGEDLQYVFAWGLNPTIAPIVGQSDDEKFMSVEVMRYWTNFVKSGNPNQPLASSRYPEWPRYTMPEQAHKDLSINMTNGRAMRAADCSFWINFMPRIHVQTAPIEEISEDWEKQYELWRDVDVPEWTSEFETYKEENTCQNP